MGLFSFGNKDDDAPRRRRAADKPARGEGLERRSRRAGRADASSRGGSAGADAMLLDPTLPEKQRARRRLVGAIALVIAAVVLLPMVLDSHPKPVTDDIAIDIPNRPASVPNDARGDSSAADTQDQQDADTQAGVAPDNPTASGAISTGGVAGIAAATPVVPTPAAQQSASGVRAAKPGASVSPQATTHANTSQPSAHAGGGQPVASQQTQQRTQPTGQGQQVQQTTKQSSQTSPAVGTQPVAAAPAQGTSGTSGTTTSDSATSADTGGARFAVELGVFTDDASARVWEAKLKAAGVPAYIGHRKQADGTMRTLLRAGPFPDRAAASAAIAKVRQAGLMASSNNATQ